MKVNLIWWDGSTTTGSSWEGAERALRAAQWTTYDSRAAFRRDLRHRAKAWSGDRPDLVHCSSEEFLRALEAHGLCRVEIEDEDEDEGQEADTQLP